MYSTKRLYEDWLAAERIEANREDAEFTTFIKKMQEYYKPTEHNTLKNFKFRALAQRSNESFHAFCNRVEREAKHCQFKCEDENCTAESTAVRDQIIIGLSQDDIRKDALRKSWNLEELKVEGMKRESATKGAAEIEGESTVLKVGKYSYKNIKRQKI